jgi:hypothetical protein
LLASFANLYSLGFRLRAVSLVEDGNSEFVATENV